MFARTVAANIEEKCQEFTHMWFVQVNNVITAETTWCWSYLSRNHDYAKCEKLQLSIYRTLPKGKINIFSGQPSVHID